MRRMTSAVLALAAALLVILFTANVAGAQAPSATVSVTGNETTWSPPNVTVTTGQTVRWTFTGSNLNHNVHGTNDQADWSPPLQTTPAINQAAGAPSTRPSRPASPSRVPTQIAAVTTGAAR